VSVHGGCIVETLLYRVRLRVARHSDVAADLHNYAVIFSAETLHAEPPFCGGGFRQYIKLIFFRINKWHSSRWRLHATYFICPRRDSWCNRPSDAASKQPLKASGHYLFAWTGDVEHKGNDFLAVIDADPASPSYGHLVTTIMTDQQTMRVHHTEYTMPASSMLFANDHDAGRTFIFDLRDPLHPKLVTSFTDMAGYMHPHSYQRLPNGHVLATFQHVHHGASTEPMGKTGGLVEIDDQGKVIRSASSADPAFSGALLTPYSLVVLPELDRVVSTNSSMELEDVFAGVTYQVWRLSDLKLLKTEYFDVGENRYAQISPEEPRLGPDGSVFVQTLGCGLERITGTEHRRAQIAAGIYLSWQLVRCAHHSWTLSGAERRSDAWFDRARHYEFGQARRSLTTKVER